MEIIRKPVDGLEFEKVEIKEPTVDDLIKAERLADGQTGVAFAVALLSQIAEFDGQKLPPEDIRKLKLQDFLFLVREVENFGLRELAKQLSSSQKKPE